MTDPQPTPAATLIVFRDRKGAPPELLIVKRASVMSFAAGALVFPGGRVDPGDHVLAAGAADPEDGAARVAAIRETLEESGIAIGFDPMPDPETVAALRQAMVDGMAFGEAIARGGWRLDLDMLVPWARWCPNFRETRAFDTRFYIARLPENAPEPSVDASENTHIFWADADTVLDRARSGAARVIFPTWRNLERLALFADFDAAAAYSANYPIRLIRPWVEQRESGPYLLIPDDLGYPVTEQPLSEVSRA
ncbi:NUDIX hydrolase [Sphingomonas colocasiae]|uniref:NUDIX domain-containing protein n=1 Tax=Sphingomonas colocasiae TaxID=1848973 RepID=A0ABS7PU16_9SPHN|nr:NUDIX domain-containing protein [Sphingomonas colocasiae]MBY8824847.1 NUDIX domain-containing protein [Sphingomonas colocasiae]